MLSLLWGRLLHAFEADHWDMLRGFICLTGMLTLVQGVPGRESQAPMVIAVLVIAVILVVPSGPWESAKRSTFTCRLAKCPGPP